MQINKNTYYQIPRYLIALIFSNNRSGKYQCNKTELTKGWFFTVEIPAMKLSLKIPFKAILKDNTKIKGIKGFNFSTATGCRSYKKGLCQVKNILNCYAFQGEERNKNDIIKETGALKMNSRHQIYLNMLFNEKIKQYKILFNKFIEYLNIKIPYLRFNVNGDFRNESDINLLFDICSQYKNISYGYTAADDLKGLQELQKVTALLGSNKKYTNKYTCTFSLETYFKAILKNLNCMGSCLNCCKCWTLKDVELINLFHKKDADIILNTFQNRQFIIKLFKAFNINITDKDLQKLQGLFNSINKYFKEQYNQDLKDNDINNLKDLLYYTANCSHYDIQDNKELYNIELLKELSLCY